MSHFSSASNVEVARQLTQATRSGVQLGEALSAAAEGTSNHRLQRVLRSVAERIQRGEPLEQVLTKESPLPATLAGLLKASLVTGQPAMAISQWLFIREQARAHWQNVMGALYYPLISLAATYVLFLFLSLWLMTDLRKMLEELGLTLPESTRAIFWLMDFGVPTSFVLLGASLLMLVLIRLIGGRSGWSSFVSYLPVIGPLWHWSGSSEFLRALALLLDQHIPLPQALQLTAAGISDAALARHAQKLASRVEQGAALAQAMQIAPELPASIFPLIRQGERIGTLPDSLRAAADMLESRLQAQANMVLHLAPTVVFLIIAAMVMMIVAGFMIPLLTLIRGLT
ncbi:type II secretion system F family protein [Anatilimnocola sp. NA78]|uniref:type II secretion system F family protein n=1 Tax=Anatilimnocola sp. NA78 TaxID=3415683 RepID=UPI003CE57A7E